jgi:hypothetical protein
MPRDAPSCTLEHFPEKWIRFSEEEMLQYYDVARYLPS